MGKDIRQCTQNKDYQMFSFYGVDKLENCRGTTWINIRYPLGCLNSLFFDQIDLGVIIL